MKSYHLYFYILKFLILVLIALMSLKIIPVKNKISIIIDFIFKLSFGIFIIAFFSTNNNKLNRDDRILIILSGFILILLIDYIAIINILFNKHIKDPKCICDKS